MIETQENFEVFNIVIRKGVLAVITEGFEIADFSITLYVNGPLWNMDGHLGVIPFWASLPYKQPS